MAASSQRPRSSRQGSAIYLGSGESPKLTNGFASVQVGLGSPRFDFARRSATASPEKMSPLGLPSPPNTESDIALPSPYRSASSSKSSTPAPVVATAGSSHIARSSPGIQPSPGLQRTPSIARSSSISSTASSSRKIRPKASPSLSASHSSAASSKLSALKPKSAEKRANGNSNHASPSPGKGSPHRAPAGTPTERNARRLSKRISGSWESGLAEEAIEEENERPGNDLDERIRQAEEKIRRSNQGRRQSREKEITSPGKGTLRRHDSYTRTSGGRAAESPTVNNQATLRRSATLTSASVWPDTPNKTPDGDVMMDEHQRDRSGGSSGSGRRKPLPTEFRTNTNPFTPSPKASTSSNPPSQPQPSSSRSSRLSRSPEDPIRASPLPSRFSSERVSREATVESPRRYRPAVAPDGLGRASSLRNREPDVAGYAHRQWSESISGLPQVDRLDQRGLPFPRDRPSDRLRAESVMATTPDRRYDSPRQPLSARASRTPLRPQDSISAVGARSERTDTPPSGAKDPLDVIRRMEAQRNQHNRQWEQDRAASVIGEVSHSPRRANGALPRAVTSMSSLRDHAPATAPLDRIRHWSPDLSSPTARGFSRSVVGPSTEPRTMRSSTSLGGRPGTSLSLDTSAPLAEHCRLLFEAFRALEMKLSPELLATQSELMRAFLASTKNLEGMNSSLRSAAALITDLCVQLELEENPHRNDFNHIADIVRDNAKSSDQAVRDLTRIMLDLPKLVRQGGRASGQGEGSSVRRTTSISSHLSGDPAKPSYSSNQMNGYADSPLASRPFRHSTEMLRPETSAGTTDSPSRYSYRNPPPFGAGSSRVRDRPSTMSSFVSKVRGSAPPRSTISDPALDPIEASPPSAPASRMPSASYAKDTAQDKGHRVLKKKASSASTNTVRGSSFMPASSRVKTTTAVSNINAGTGEESPPSRAMQTMQTIEAEGNESDGVARRRSSYYRIEGGRRRETPGEREVRLDSEEEFSGGSYGQDADPIAVLEQRLADAAKEREERASTDGHSQASEGSEGNRRSITDRVRDTLRAGGVGSGRT